MWFVVLIYGFFHSFIPTILFTAVTIAENE